MRKLLSLMIAAALAAVSCQSYRQVGCAPGDRTVLDKGWTLRCDRTGESWPAEVPSTVAGVVFPDDVLPADTAFFSGSWTYSLKFGVDDPSRHYLLRFGGVGYRAAISLNGQMLSSPDTTFGVFAVREYNLSGLLRRRNTLEVTLEKARPGDLNIGFVDWNPAPPDASMGLVQEVSLHCVGGVQIKDVFVKPLLSDDLASADIEVRATLCNLGQKAVRGCLKGTTDGLDFSQEIALQAGEKREIVLPAAVHLDNPRLWWSRDLGHANLYEMNLAFEADGLPLDRESVSYGVRKIESGLDELGHRFWKLNGRTMLLLGGGWTDDVLLRDSHSSLEHQIRLAAEANLNLIRFENIWGKDSYIYDLCDRYGLLALVGWSCQWEWENYCGVPHDRFYGCIDGPEMNALALRYFSDQVKRLRNHPSVIGWMTGSDRMPNPDLEIGYLDLYAKLDNRPYVCSASGLSSLAGPSGNKMAGPYEYVGPEYWYDAAHRLGAAWGFNTETSIGMNIPQMESLRSMLGDDIWPLGPAWDAHCTVAAENMHDTHVMQEVVAGQFGEVADLESFVARAQAIDYEGTRAMFEAFRLNDGQARGVVQWMINSAWPSLYWQLWDWYGIPTAGYYGVRKSCTPVQILYDWQNRAFSAVNSSAEDRILEASLRIFEPSGTELPGARISLELASGSIVPLGIDLPKGKDLLVFIEGGADNFYAIPAKGNVHDWAHSNWYQTPISSYADKRFLAALPQPQLKLERHGGEFTVSNLSPYPAFQIVLKALRPDGALVPEAFWSDNFFSLPPAGSKTVSCSWDGEVQMTCGL